MEINHVWYTFIQKHRCPRCDDILKEKLKYDTVTKAEAASKDTNWQIGDPHIAR